MPNRVQSLRSNVAGSRPTGRLPGELYVNWADNQLGSINGSNSPQDLIAVRFFSTAAAYNVGDYVVQAGSLYQALVAVTAGAFNVTQWVKVGGSVTVSDTAPTVAQQGNMWWDSVGGTLYVFFQDANSSQWVPASPANSSGIADAPSDSNAYLRSNNAWTSGGTLTAPLILQGDPTTNLGAATKQYVDAVPRNRNKLINGDMRINQRGSSTGAAAQNYTIDRWYSNCSVAGKGTWSWLNTTAAPGFPNALVFTSSSAYAVAAGDFFQFSQIIEAQNLAESMWGTSSALPCVLSFWAYGTIAGTYGGSIRNSAVTRSYPFTFTLLASTWTYVTIPIPGDAAGTWTLSGNGGALYVTFGLGCGATYSGPAGAWTNGNFATANGAVSVVGTNGAVFYITGVQFEFGTVATPFERRQIGEELMLCQRYFEKGYADGTAPGAVSTGAIGLFCYATGLTSMTNSGGSYVSFKVTKRTAPTATVYSTSGASGKVRDNNGGADINCTVSNATTNGFTWSATLATAQTIVNMIGNWTADAEL